MVECVQEPCNYGRKLGLGIVIENHNHGGLLSASKDVLRFFRERGKEKLGLQPDTGSDVDGVGGIRATVHLVKRHAHQKINGVAKDGQDTLYNPAALLDNPTRSGYAGLRTAVSFRERPRSSSLNLKGTVRN